MDSHVHLDWFPPEAVPAIVARAEAAGVTRMLTVGSQLDSSRRAVEIANSFPAVLAAIGVHPGRVEGELREQEMGLLRELAGDEQVVAIGEIGLDAQSSRASLDVQSVAFRAQLHLAYELGLPVVLHFRGAFRQGLQLMRDERLDLAGAIAHYFVGDLTEAREYVDRGILVSFGKPLLRSAELAQVAASLPLESILIETDAYPREPDRWTEPADVRLVAQKLAEVRRTSMEEVAAVLAANFRRFLPPGRSERLT